MRKIGYSCTTYIKNIIKSHNKKVLANHIPDSEPKGCNCRDESACPLPKKDLTKTVYEATGINGDNVCAVYHGLTEGNFKQRYSGHKYDFKPIILDLAKGPDCTFFAEQITLEMCSMYP